MPLMKAGASSRARRRHQPRGRARRDRGARRRARRRRARAPADAARRPGRRALVAADPRGAAATSATARRATAARSAARSPTRRPGPSSRRSPSRSTRQIEVRSQRGDALDRRARVLPRPERDCARARRADHRRALPRRRRRARVQAFTRSARATATTRRSAQPRSSRSTRRDVHARPTLVLLRVAADAASRRRRRARARQRLDEPTCAARRGVVDELDPPDDIEVSGTYRRRVAGDLARRALLDAAARAAARRQRDMTRQRVDRCASQVNGAWREGIVEPRRTLADFLREDLDLTGTHLACEHGFCGNCNVLVDGADRALVPDARRAGRRPLGRDRRGPRRARRHARARCSRRSPSTTACSAGSARPRC